MKITIPSEWLSQEFYKSVISQITKVYKSVFYKLFGRWFELYEEYKEEKRREKELEVRLMEIRWKKRFPDYSPNDLLREKEMEAFPPLDEEK